MIIGLTGSIASGKSTVSNILLEKGYPIVDADRIARQVVEPGTAVIQQIEEAFGRDVIHEDGTLNRERLGTLIFDEEEKRKRLNNIIHPAIRAEMLRQKEAHLQAGAKTVIMDIPLLFESNLQSYVEKIVVVAVTPAIQQERLMKRNGFTEEEAANRIASQISVEEKAAAADAVIDNNGTVEETEKQVIQLLEKWGL
ncbi:MAG TPA: dephospho-CoA kinase [Sporosarcina sp.]|nr:dephospho-CoA kinase [Sporosarcina sp.]